MIIEKHWIIQLHHWISVVDIYQTCLNFIRVKMLKSQGWLPPFYVFFVIFCYYIVSLLWVMNFLTLLWPRTTKSRIQGNMSNISYIYQFYLYFLLLIIFFSSAKCSRLGAGALHQQIQSVVSSIMQHKCNSSMFIGLGEEVIDYINYSYA